MLAIDANRVDNGSVDLIARLAISAGSSRMASMSTPSFFTCATSFRSDEVRLAFGRRQGCSRTSTSSRDHPPSASSLYASTAVRLRAAIADIPVRHRALVLFLVNRARNRNKSKLSGAGIRIGELGLNTVFTPSRSTAGSGSGEANPGVTQPAFPQDAPAPTVSRSRTCTRMPRSCRYHATDRPTMPPPTTPTVRNRGRSARSSLTAVPAPIGDQPRPHRRG